MLKISLPVLVFIMILFSQSKPYAQANSLLPLITYECGDINALVSRLHLGEGSNPVCTTPEGSKIYVQVHQGKIIKYSVVDAKGKDVQLMPLHQANVKQKSSGQATRCPSGQSLNCACIPSRCFCEITSSEIKAVSKIN